MRARIDGRVHELDAAPRLALYKKHDIEAVVDRFKVRPDLRLRLAESFETGYGSRAAWCASWLWRCPRGRYPRGRCRGDDARGHEAGGEEMVFSARFSCPHCGYSLNELEPRLFFFNNPAGACPSATGSGCGSSSTRPAWCATRR